MKREELLNKWLEYELRLYILPYMFLYGENYVKDPYNSKWLLWQFERDWSRKSEEEKQKRFDRFYQQITESEDNEDERNY